MRIYLAGPMSGIKDLNFPAFVDAGERIRSCGHSVFVPNEDMERYPGFDCSNPETFKNLDMSEIMCKDLIEVLAADAIVLLPGWENSQGARLERIVAESTGKLVFEYKAYDDHLHCLAPAKSWHHPAIYQMGRRKA